MDDTATSNSYLSLVVSLYQNETPQEVTSFPRKNSGLSRKPLLTKSNTFSTRRTDHRTKAPGVAQDPQENAYLHQASVRRLCQVNGLSPLSRRSAEGPGQLETTSKESSVRLVGEMAETDSNSKTEDMASSRRLEDDSNGGALGPSDAGSDASQRVSEIATDAGPDTMSDFSDADEFRSVSSEPISRFSSLGKMSSLRTESSKMSLLSGQSGLSFFTAGSWGSDNSRSLDNLLASVEGTDGRRDVAEDIFPEFPEGSDFLVGDADALELSFLDAGAADPEMIVNARDHGAESDRFDAMHSPMARDYVNYNRGSETDVPENCVGSDQVPIAGLTSDQDKNLRDVSMADCDVAETADNTADEERESPAALPFEHGESEELGLINDEVVSKDDRLARGTEAAELQRSCSGDIAKEGYVADDVLKQNEFKSGGSRLEIASDMEHSDVDGWGVDTPTQSESCSHDDGTSSVSNGVRYSEGYSSRAEPSPEDTEDGSEIHSRLPEGEATSESGSPAFDSKDYSVAKKLEFEHSPKEGPAIRLPETTEDEVSAVHSKVSYDGHSNSDSEPLPQPHLDISSVAPTSVNDSDSSPTNTSSAPELDRSGFPVEKREGYNVKSRDGQCASTCEPVDDYNKVSDVEGFMSW